jgi:recombination protein RecT
MEVKYLILINNSKMSRQETLKEKMGVVVPQSDVKTALAKASIPNTLAGLSRVDLSKVIGHMGANIAQALPKHITPDRMMQIIINALDKNPAIKECQVSSIVGCIMQASILGFKPIDSLGQVYFVPYKQKDGTKQLQIQIGYKGFIDLARRSNQIKMLYAEVVREGDQFEYEVGLFPKLIHKPTGKSEGKITHVYAVAHYKEDGYNFIVLTFDEVEKLRKRNPQQGATPSGAWYSDYAKMAKAKAIKQLATYMPLNDEMQEAVRVDESVIDLKDGGVLDESLQYEEPPIITIEFDEKTGEVKNEETK